LFLIIMMYVTCKNHIHPKDDDIVYTCTGAFFLAWGNIMQKHGNFEKKIVCVLILTYQWLIQEWSMAHKRKVVNKFCQTLPICREGSCHVTTKIGQKVAHNTKISFLIFLGTCKNVDQFEIKKVAIFFPRRPSKRFDRTRHWNQYSINWH